MSARKQQAAPTVASHLDALEAESVHIIRDADATLGRVALLWSLGKDSNVKIWLCDNAFFGHVRVHPLQHWSEIDFRHYTAPEGIPTISLYCANEGKRYRSLGDEDITHPIASDASVTARIIAEPSVTRVAERAGPGMNLEAEDSFERLRADGYM